MILYLTIHSHFSILMLVLMALSGLISFLLPRLPFLFMAVVLGVISCIYAFTFDMAALAPSIISIIIATSSIPILLVKYTLYLQRKAEQLSTLQNT